ncbi:hypothetical protein HYV88_02610 [Candidatus Woesearchaeota archaeon]|nr:hypothetical protein [Candidatus Woesearchaeota archaeon]
MKIELLNPYVIKILISARKIDSVSSISKRINLSYGWTHRWIKELVTEGIFKEKWRGIVLEENNKTYKKILKFIKENFLNEISFHYSILGLFGIKYCYTKTDAVYVYVEGRYNIARYKEYYPIFIKIKEADYDIFLYYCKKLNLKIKSKKGVFYVPEVLNDFKMIKIKNIPIEPLDETIEFMKKNIYNFEPALEMIRETYNKRLKTKYSEVNFL